MTVQSIRSEIVRFLANSTPEVLCISGKWGVGKTFLWRQALLTAPTISMGRYAYISLFGLNSLEELKYAAFENAVAAAQINTGPTFETLKTQAQSIEQFFRRNIYLARGAPFTDGLLGSAKTAFLAVRNQLICIDDLERHGKNLDLKDVLGLVSFLKEQRGCKLVLLLNEEALSEHSEEAFRTQLEKVIDTRLSFNPTPNEAAEIGITKSTAIASNLAENCLRLGIKNIRVIQKIERVCLMLATELKAYDPAVLYQAVHTATLFGWVHYQPQEAPSFEFVRNHNTFIHAVRRHNQDYKPSDEEKQWSTLLSVYEFNRVDEFDAVVIECIRDGFIQTEALAREASKLNKTIEAQKRDNSFHEAWQNYHGSLTTSADEVLDGLYKAFKDSVDTITPLHLNGTISFFKELGRFEQAAELLTFYMTHRDEERRFYNLSESNLMEREIDPDVAAAFLNKAAEFTDERDPKDILIGIVKNSSWNSEDLARVERLSVEEFKAIFLSTTGTDLSRVVRAALQFKNMGGASEQARAMANRAEEALRQIGAQSPVNARRVRAMGVEIQNEDESA